MVDSFIMWRRRVYLPSLVEMEKDCVFLTLVDEITLSWSYGYFVRTYRYACGRIREYRRRLDAKLNSILPGMSMYKKHEMKNDEIVCLVRAHIIALYAGELQTEILSIFCIFAL